MTKNDKTQNWQLDTILTHGNNKPEEYHGFVNPPVVHASTVLHPDAATLKSRGQKYTYATKGTSTTQALADNLSMMESSEGTLLYPSGLASITIPLMSFLSAGDHMLVVDSIYGPTRRFCDTVLKKFGVDVTYFHPNLNAGVEELMRPNTKVVFTEAPASNTFEMQDIPAIAEVAHAHGAIVMMDNTWATPMFFKPLDFGVDVSVNAATKFQGGHSDVLMGYASANGECLEKLMINFEIMGCCPGPDDCYLVMRGLKTMSLRIRHQEQMALKIAKYLETQKGVARVLHPALPSFESHDIWKRDFSGSTSIFSIVLDCADKTKWDAKADACVDAFDLFGIGYSWAGHESLVVPVNLSDRTIAKPPAEGPVVRLQIGLEGENDLMDDIEKALAAANAV